MIVSLIVAMSENRVIGKNGEMPWRLSADLRRFRKLTMGHTIIMGRRTWDSIGKLLPGRKTAIITRNRDFQIDGATVVGNLDDALSTAENENEFFVVGGAEIYRLALPVVRKIYMTRVLARIDGDTFFPEIDWQEWTLVDSESHTADEKNNYDLIFEIWERRRV